MLTVKKAGMLSVVGMSAVLLAGLAGNALAGGHKYEEGHHGRGGPDGMYSERMLDRMAEKLSLDDATKGQIQAMMEERRGQMEGIHEKMREQHEALQALDPKSADYMEQVSANAQAQGELTTEVVKMRAEAKAKLYALLSDEQIQELETLMAERGHHSKKGRH